MSSEFEPLGERTLHDGFMGRLKLARFRHADGAEVEREIFEHPGAVAVVAHDGEQLYLVRQPREAVGVPDLLELPAGKLDGDGETPLATGKRELAEEIGKAAAQWTHLVSYYSSPGFTDEQVHVFLATGLRDVERPETEEDERIEVVTWPLSDLAGLVGSVQDGKTLVGVLHFWRYASR